MLYLLIFLAFIGIAVGLTWFFLAHDRGEKEPVGALWIAVGFGLLGGIAAAILEVTLLGVSDSLEGHLSWALFGRMLSVGVIEEACKFLPLALFLYKKRYFNEHTDGIIYFALAGFGFGLPENIMYTLAYGGSAGLVRIFLTPFFHAATTAMVGYYLAKGKISKQGWSLAIPALLIAMTVHGIYDFSAASGSIGFAFLSFGISLGVSGSLFVFYAVATNQDQRHGLSAIGTNNFCRSCGYPNPSHTLYCSNCGRYA